MEGWRNHQTGGLPGKNGSPRLNLPQARAWKEFKIGELFNAQTGDVDLQQKDIDGNGEIFVNSGVENCGIKGRTSRLARVFPANTITVDFFGNAYYRSYPYKMATHNHVFSLSGDILKNESVGLYIVGAMSHLVNVFSYNDMGTWSKIKVQSITLPVTLFGDVDFEYMESYICEIESARVRELENYLNDVGLNDCELSLKEKLAVESCQDGRMLTAEFAIGDLFVVKSNPQLNKESFSFTSTSEYPYFTRTVFNNGILGKVDYLDEAHKINGGSLAVGMLGMQFFYMEHDFYAGQFTKTVFLKDGGRLDEKLALWFASLFNKAKGHFQKGLVRDFERLFLSLKIQLPVKPNGKPDFDTMRDLISGVMKLSIRGVVEWKDREIAVTKKSFSSSSDSMSTVVVPADGFIGMNAEEYLEAAGLPSGEDGDEYAMPPEEPLT